jgi:hypothetical protein
MREPEQRVNDEFRRRLQRRWVDEARTSRRPVPVDAQALWRKIEARVERDEAVAPSARRRFATLVAAAAGLLVAVGLGIHLQRMGRNEPSTPKNRAATPTDVAAISAPSEPRQSLMRPWSSGCDATRQSCAAPASIASLF